uniref:Kinase n=1 Tax=Ciona intestinalis TaxID=7719 RepID=F6ZUQ2_CIOIN
MTQSSTHDEIDVKKILNWRRFSRDWEKPFALKPFGHQVGGRASILCYNPSTICKPYVSRELYFYHNMPTYLKEFTPDFRGTVNVTFIEEATGYLSLVHCLFCCYFVISIFQLHKNYTSGQCRFTADPIAYLVISALRENSSDIISDDMDMLTYGFGANMSIRSHTSGNRNEMEGESMGLQNPWNTKVMVDALTKLRSKNTEDKKKFHTKTKRFILLENVTSPYKRPCVLDLKIGTRVRQDASAAKLARHATAIDFGARLSGMQIYSPLRNEFAYLNKYYGHNLTVEGFKRKFVDFFSRGAVSSFRRLVRCTISKLERLREAISKIGNHRFYSCSVLLIYEGQLETEDESQTKCSNSSTPSSSPADCPPSVDVRLIDFAHYCFHDHVVHPGPDGGFLFGIDNVIALLGDMLTS